ncbi:hypothetical protein BGZ81_003959 [Podila clonocystis]|nr:hypothetical protein BGZ81_003959 [Podila clonocystis]
MPPDKATPLKLPRLRSRPKEGSPFYPLVYYVYARIQSVYMPLPDIPSDLTSPNHRDLYVLARCHLAQMKGFGRKFSVPEELLNILSGVVNAYWPSALLSVSIAPHIEDMSLVPALETINPIVTVLKQELLSALCPGINEDPNAVPSIAFLNTLIASRLSVLGIAQDEFTESIVFLVFKMMQHLALLTGHNNTAKAPDFIRIWCYVLKDILAGHLSFPIIAETHGSQVTLYSIRRYGDVFGVGLATHETITIPTNVQELKSFLQSNNLDILLAFGKHMRAHATHVRDVLEATKRDDRTAQPPGTMPHVVWLPSVREESDEDRSI